MDGAPRPESAIIAFAAQVERTAVVSSDCWFRIGEVFRNVTLSETPTRYERRKSVQVVLLSARVTALPAVGSTSEWLEQAVREGERETRPENDPGRGVSPPPPRSVSLSSRRDSGAGRERDPSRKRPRKRCQRLPASPTPAQREPLVSMGLRKPRHAPNFVPLVKDFCVRVVVSQFDGLEAERAKKTIRVSDRYRAKRFQMVREPWSGSRLRTRGKACENST